MRCVCTYLKPSACKPPRMPAHELRNRFFGGREGNRIESLLNRKINTMYFRCSHIMYNRHSTPKLYCIHCNTIYTNDVQTYRKIDSERCGGCAAGLSTQFYLKFGGDIFSPPFSGFSRPSLHLGTSAMAPQHTQMT